MKILIADELGQEPLHQIRVSFPDQTVVYAKDPGVSFEQELTIADVLIVRSATKATKELLDKAPKLFLVARYGNGLDGIDSEECARRGIEIINAPAASANSVAEATIGVMIALLRKLPMQMHAMLEGKWLKLTGNELTGKTLGLVGYGRIGHLVAEKARAFGVNVITFDPFVVGNGVPGVSRVDLEKLLAQSDVISLHPKLTEANRGMINAVLIAKMKNGAHLINFARAELIAMEDLCDAIESGKLAGVHIDVHPNEPKKSKADFNAGRIAQLARQGLNVSLSCHVGGSTEEAQARIADELIPKIRSAIDARDLRARGDTVRPPTSHAAEAPLRRAGAQKVG